MAIFGTTSAPSYEEIRESIESGDFGFGYWDVLKSNVVSWGDLEVATRLVKEYGGGEYSGDFYTNEALDAVASGNLEMVKLVEEHGANYTVVDRDKLAYEAVRSGNLEMVKLVKKEYGGDFIDADLAAVQSGSLEMVKLVKEYGGKFTEKDALAAMALESRNPEMVKLVKEEYDGDFRALTDAAWLAVRSGNPEVVKLVKEYGVHDFSDVAVTAADSGNPEMVKLVKEYGGNFTGAGKWTGRSGNPEMVKLVEEIAAEQREEKARAAQSARPVDVYLSKEKEDEREAERVKIRAATEKSIAEHDPMPELGKEGGASKSSTESQESPDDPAR